MMSERPFRALRRINNYLMPTMTQKMMNNLTMSEYKEDVDMQLKYN